MENISILEMSLEDALNTLNNETDITAIRAYADLVEVKYSGNSGIDTIREKIKSELKELMAEPETQTPEVNPAITQETSVEATPEAPVETSEAQAQTQLVQETVPEALQEPEEPFNPQVAQVQAPSTDEDLMSLDPKFETDPLKRRQIIRAKALRLVRIQIRNLDPGDADIPGAIISLYNKYTGKVAKYVPYSSDEPYHVPYMLLKHLQNKTYVLRKKVPGGQFGVQKYKTEKVKKFAITILPDLTEEEMEDLAKKQVAAGTVGT